MTLNNIVIIFRECKNLEELDISGCHIKSITNQNTNELPFLTSINLSNITCENIKVPHFISSILRVCLNLKKVIITNNNLHDSGASKICDILIKLGLNTNIQVLDLSNNDIGSFGFSSISKLLRYSKIKDLNISGNNLQNGAFSCVIKALSFATNLERLNMSNTKINLKCLQKLEFKLKIFRSLLFLDLSKNNICNSGLEIIAKFVNKFFIKIEFLNLSNNNTSIKGNTKFITKLQNCKNINIIIGN
jgi:Ran GTPase-activating protein (RanGAP) involved in mRNA processing and transport